MMLHIATIDKKEYVIDPTKCIAIEFLPHDVIPDYGTVIFVVAPSKEGIITIDRIGNFSAFVKGVKTALNNLPEDVAKGNIVVMSIGSIETIKGEES